jgi:hypothetical protein
MGHSGEPWGVPLCVGKAPVLYSGRQRVVVLLLIKLSTHFTIHYGLFLSLLLCKSLACTTLSNAPVEFSESSVATLS